MKSLLRSRKGVETAPLFMVLSAVILVMTVAIVVPAMAEWGKVMDRGKAVKETVKLQESIEEIHTMGDVGSVERVFLALPSGYSIVVRENSLVLKIRNNEVVELPVDAKLECGGAELDGKKTVTVAFWKDSSPTAPIGDYLLRVYNK